MPELIEVLSRIANAIEALSMTGVDLGFVIFATGFLRK